MRTFRVLVLAIVALGFTLPAAAQRTTADLQGTVTDEQGAVLPGATVTIRNQSTGLVRTVVTDAGGRYLVRGLPVEGSYDVRADLQGFASVVYSETVLLANQARVLDFKMKVATVQETVTVSAAAPLIDTVQSTVQQTVNEKMVRELPLFGRSFLHLASLAAGFTGNPSFPGVSGQNYFTNNVMVDGASHFSKWRSAARTYYSGYGLESIKEVQVLTNRFSAEFGDALGSVTSAVTKSGTNDVHGTALVYAQTDGLNAMPWKATRKPPLSFQQYGFTLGGPFIKDKLHYFASFEGRRQRSNLIVTSPVASGTAVPNDQDETLVFFKVDYQLGQRHLLTARYNGQLFDWQNEYGGLSLPGTGDRYQNNVHTVFFMDTFQISSRLLNETRVQFARYSDRRTDLERSVLISRTGYSSEGGTYGPPGFGAIPEDTYEGSNTFSYWAGQHALKFGAGFKYVKAKNPQLMQGWGQYYFAGSPSLYPAPYQFAQAFAINPGSEIANPRSIAVFGFFQDDWKIRPHLTLNLGARYDIEKPYNIRNFTAPVDKSKIQPRVGMTWDPKGDGRTAIRGGIGLYSNQHLFFHLNKAQILGADGTVTVVIPSSSPLFPTYPNALPAFPPGAVLPARDIWRVDPTLKNPYALQGSVGFQRTIVERLILSADFIYLNGIDLLGTIDANAAASVPKGTVRSVAAADLTRPIVPGPNGFRKIYTITNEGRSWYRALQVKASRSTAQFNSMVSYTFSKATDMLNPWSLPEESWNIEADKGLSNQDQRHNFVGSISWFRAGQGNLAGGWGISGIVQLRDGRPYNITFGGDPSGTTQSDARSGDRNLGKTAGFQNLDLALIKRLTVRRTTIEARLEAFNALNRTIYAGYTGAQSSATFGRPISAYEKRRVQLAAIVRF